MPPRRSQYPSLWLALAIALCCRHGAAASPNLRVALEYVADPALACPSTSELKASVASQLGYDPFTSDGAEPRLRIEITRVADRAEAQIEWFDRQLSSEGERHLASESGDCAELARNLVFAVAVQIQLHASASEPPPTVPPPPPSPPAPPHPVTPRAAEPHPDSATERRVVSLGAGALLRHGLTPGVSPGFRIFGALSKSWGSLELSAHATLPAQLQYADGTGFTAHELGANLVPCLRFSPAGVCAVGSLSMLNVRGQGVDHIGTPSGMTGGVGLRLQLLWPALERLGVLVQGEALAVLAPRDILLNQTTVWTTAPVAFTAILDFAALFP